LLSINGVMLIISIMALDVLSWHWWLTVLLSFVVIFTVLSICELITLKSSKEKQPPFEVFELIDEGEVEVKGVLTLLLILLLIFHAAIMSVYTVYQVSEGTFAGDNVMEVAVNRCKDWSTLNDVGVLLPWSNTSECEDVISKQLKWEIAGCSLVYAGIIATLAWKLSKLRVSLFYDPETEIES